MKIRTVLLSAFQIWSNESGMLISDSHGKYWTDFDKTSAEHVKWDYILCEYKFEIIRIFRIPDLA